MKFSTKSEYGLMAMAELAQAYGRGPVSVPEIAQAQGLPLDYLEQLLARLRRAGLVLGTRGSRGGYQLARAPIHISVGQIVRVLEGPVGVMDCAPFAAGKGECRRQATCPSRPFWTRLQNSLSQVLETTTLDDIMASTSEKLPAGTVSQD